jgi:hypothetical protein
VDWTYTSDIHVYIIVRGKEVALLASAGCGRMFDRGWGMIGAILTRLGVYG